VRDRVIYSITRSARTRIAGGSVSPSAFAVLALMISSNGPDRPPLPRGVKRGEIGRFAHLRQRHDDDRQFSEFLEDGSGGGSEPPVAREENPKAFARRHSRQLSVRQFPPAPFRGCFSNDTVAMKESGEGGRNIDVKQPHRSDR
jgi:hypothetical protein